MNNDVFPALPYHREERDVPDSFISLQAINQPPYWSISNDTPSALDLKSLEVLQLSALWWRFPFLELQDLQPWGHWRVLPPQRGSQVWA